MKYAIDKPRRIDPNRVFVAGADKQFNSMMRELGYTELYDLTAQAGIAIHPSHIADEYALKMARFIGDEGQNLRGPRRDLCACSARELMNRYATCDAQVIGDLDLVQNEIPSTQLRAYRLRSVAKALDQDMESLRVAELLALIAENMRSELASTEVAKKLPDDGPLAVDPRAMFTRECFNKPAGMLSRIAHAMGTTYRHLIFDVNEYIRERNKVTRVKGAVRSGFALAVH